MTTYRRRLASSVHALRVTLSGKRRGNVGLPGRRRRGLTTCGSQLCLMRSIGRTGSERSLERSQS